jgi:hypothetical protein
MITRLKNLSASIMNSVCVEAKVGSAENQVDKADEDVPTVSDNEIFTCEA